MDQGKWKLGASYFLYHLTLWGLCPHYPICGKEGKKEGGSERGQTEQEKGVGEG